MGHIPTKPKKNTDQMSFDELVDWAAGYILTELIGGRLKSATFVVLQQAIRWREVQREKEQQK